MLQKSWEKKIEIMWSHKHFEHKNNTKIIWCYRNPEQKQIEIMWCHKNPEHKNNTKITWCYRNPEKKKWNNVNP